MPENSWEILFKRSTRRQKKPEEQDFMIWEVHESWAQTYIHVQSFTVSNQQKESYHHPQLLLSDVEVDRVPGTDPQPLIPSGDAFFLMDPTIQIQTPRLRLDLELLNLGSVYTFSEGITGALGSELWQLLCCKQQ